MAAHNIGPVVFYEHMYYFKEVFPGKPIRVSLQLKGISEDRTYFEFVHNFYDANGKNFATCEMMGAWIDLKQRKLCPLPEALFKPFTLAERSNDFKYITKEDTRRFGKKPKDLNL